MANTHIADLPSALTINESAYFTTDSYIIRNARQMTPAQICFALTTGKEGSEE